MTPLARLLIEDVATTLGDVGRSVDYEVVSHVMAETAR